MTLALIISILYLVIVVGHEALTAVEKPTDGKRDWFSLGNYCLQLIAVLVIFFSIFN